MVRRAGVAQDGEGPVSLRPTGARSSQQRGVPYRVSRIAWATAASDLGIRVTAPYVVRDDRGGVSEFAAYLPDFGSSRGTLVWYMPDPVPRSGLGNGAVYFVSVLNPALYADYDRARFIAVLTGWGWSGRGSTPEWYHDP